MHKVLDMHFGDLDEFHETIRDWDLLFRLLDSGGFQGRGIQYVSQNMLIGYVRFERALNQRGSTPVGFRTFVLPAASCGDFWWRGQQVTNSDLLVFPASNELSSASRRGFEVYTISLRMTYIESLYENLGLTTDWRGIEVVQLDAQQMSELRNLVEMAASSAGGDVFAHRLAEGLVIHASCCRAGKRVHVRKRDLAVKRVVDYVDSVSAPDTRLTTLCRIAGVSERTLEYAFKDRYGISPNVFVKRWRLNTARRLLIRASPSEKTVASIYTGLGFLHPSQFASDYKQLFGETPSHTLARRR